MLESSSLVVGRDDNDDGVVYLGQQTIFARGEIELFRHISGPLTRRAAVFIASLTLFATRRRNHIMGLGAELAAPLTVYG
jgi:hypothetical protein